MKILKIFIITISALLISLILLLFIFSSYLDIPTKIFTSNIIDAVNQYHILEPKVNILILGTDPRHDWLESNMDTDTIILASLNLANAKLSLVSLPRDLWYQPISSRINKIYLKSLDSDHPTDYIKQTFSDITGQNINYLIIMDTDFIKNLVTTVGGLQIDLPYTLVDDQYPNPLYILDPVSNPDPYISVKFNQGINFINQDNVDYFIRSRKGSSLDSGGTDLGRSARQQMLINALFTKLSDPSNLNLPLVKNLYYLWSHDLIKDISDKDLLSLLLNLNTSLPKLTITPISLPVADTVNSTGVIYHPIRFTGGAWVYMPIENDYSNISKFLDSYLD